MPEPPARRSEAVHLPFMKWITPGKPKSGAPGRRAAIGLLRNPSLFADPLLAVDGPDANVFGAVGLQQKDIGLAFVGAGDREAAALEDDAGALDRLLALDLPLHRPGRTRLHDGDLAGVVVLAAADIRAGYGEAFLRHRG